MEIFDNLEDPAYKDQKLSFIEKSIILALIPIVKILCWKAKRAKTYGDLVKIGNLIKEKMESLEEKYEKEVNNNDEVDQEHVKNVITDLENFNRELRNTSYEKGN